MTKLTLQREFLALQIILLVAIVQAQDDNFDRQSNSECTTPSGLTGICKLLPQCEPLWNLKNTQPLSPESARFLIKSQCGTSTSLDDVKVCCPIVSNESRNGGETENADLSIVNNPNLPTDCGSDLTQRIIGGEITDLTEFPWMALIEYDTLRGKDRSCGGVLISSRYVLTAAHCMNVSITGQKWAPTAVVLGEWDTSTERDCVPDGENGSEVCADPPVSIRIEERIVHELWQEGNADRKNDVALLRLSEEVQFTGYIQPICLPSSTDIARRLWVAGWGKTETSSGSNKKLKLDLSLADKSACSMKYKKSKVNLGDSQLCAGGQIGRDTCQGDSGGPLMSFEKTPSGSRKWTAVGIVSLGPFPCGQEGWPGVYTKLIDYVPWILRKLQR